MAPKSHQNQDDSTPVRVRRGRVESVDLYEIKDNELDALEKGTPAELQLNFAVFLFSTAFAAISSLVTATFTNETVKTIYIVVSVIGCLLGAYLLIAWWRTRSEISQLCSRIRQRIPPDALAPNVIDDQEGVPPAIEDKEALPPPKG